MDERLCSQSSDINASSMTRCSKLMYIVCMFCLCSEVLYQALPDTQKIK